MVVSDVCYLITTNPGPHGVHDKPQQTERMVYCEVRSVGRSEFYQAATIGLSPEWVIKLADEAEYKGELTLRFRGELWKIIRLYRTQDGGIEMTLQRSVINRAL